MEFPVSVFTKSESAPPRYKTADRSYLTVNLIIMLLGTNALITSAVTSLHKRIPNPLHTYFTRPTINVIRYSFPQSNFLRLGAPPLTVVTVAVGIPGGKVIVQTTKIVRSLGS